MGYKVSYYCVSDIGKRRENNEDNFICDSHYLNDKIEFPLTDMKSTKNALLFGVFDGMGGEECGEVASLLAAQEAMKISFEKNPIDELSQFCFKANEAICDYIQSHPISSMGTTMACLLFYEKNVYLCNIGDSKIFRFSNHELEQLSEDHILTNFSGKKAPLYQSLGIFPEDMEIEPYYAKGYAQNEDIYLICSDGLTDMLTTEEIRNILEQNPFDEVCDILLNQALDNGGRDNITIIVCKVIKEGFLTNIFKGSD